MSRLDVIRTSEIVRTARVMQLEGIFDIPVNERSIESWSIDFDLPDEWSIGVIVGPSGSGKSTLINELYPDNIVHKWEWDNDKSIVDSFPDDMSIRDISNLLSSVGFSSPPSWLRPYRVLSNGEQFRVDIARSMAEFDDLFVVDEFTSVVDRTIAQIASAAISKSIRRRNQRFIAVTCHYDVLEWLQPDWVYQPHINDFQLWGHLQRPDIELEIARVHWKAWRVFAKHHYLSRDLNQAARCFCAFVNDYPAAFVAVLHFPHPKAKNAKRAHRTVCLPDFQGVGIGNALNETIASCVKGIGYRFLSQTSHPAMIGYRNHSDKWRMTAKPRRTGLLGGRSKIKDLMKTAALRRNVASFEYVGPSMPHDDAVKLWG